jgi:N-acetylglucosaminyl-diphospho-decaprenol L-rhamnosyltransferase
MPESMSETAMPSARMDARLQDVTVIIVTFNSCHCIADLAPALAHFPHVVFSDNASQDGSAAQARLSVPHAKVLEHASNLGFGAANNRALAQVQTPFALLLNPDCELNAEAAAQLLEVTTQYPEAAVIAPQLLRKDRSTDVNYRWPSNQWKPRCQEPAQAPCCVGFVTGAVMLFRLDHFQGIGYFDEDFFLYYEDDDLCLRLFKSKKSIVVAPQVQWLHASRGSVRGNTPYRAEYWRGYHHAQSKIIFARKHRNLEAAQRLKWQTLALALLAFPFRLVLPVPKLVARLWGRVVGLWRV